MERERWRRTVAQTWGSADLGTWGRDGRMPRVPRPLLDRKLAAELDALPPSVLDRAFRGEL